ncbi:DUF2637 domain-containing protein [Streptomyces sp. NPDC087659]|uniref:DUF2637 domain-containing protein n=1 Tax=Streptomyces sp. NPDC087659 TaxID=3365801 RepID=UPI003820DC95
MKKFSTRGVLVTGAAIVATVAMAASADTLATLGGAVGWGEEMKWSLPVSVDVLALVSGLVWLTAGLPEAARSLGRWLTLVTVGGSMVLNAIGHLVSTNHIVVGPPLVIAVSAVPPLAAALAVHLAAMTAQGGRGPKTDTAPVSVPAATHTGIGTADTARVPVRVGADTGTGTVDAGDTARPGTDTAALRTDTMAAPTDMLPVPVQTPADTAPARRGYELDTFAERAVPADADVTAPDTARPLAMPETGGRLTDAELDAVVVLLIRETDPPRSYRQMEDRFRELGYSASAARLRAAWQRVTAPTT